MDYTAERNFTARVENIPEINAFVTAQAKKAGLNAKKNRQLELIVEEAVINICRYAYEVPPGAVTVRIYDEIKKFMVEFEDGGIPFDPLAAVDPDLNVGLDEREVGGMGIFLIRRMTDEMHYQRGDGRNILTVTIYKP